MENEGMGQMYTHHTKYKDFVLRRGYEIQQGICIRTQQKDNRYMMLVVWQEWVYIIMLLLIVAADLVVLFIFWHNGTRIHG